MSGLLFVPALLGLTITLAVMTAARLLVWARAPQNLAGAFLLIAMAANLTGYLFQLVQADQGVMLAWQHLEVIGLNLAYPAWLVFVLYFTGNGRRVTPGLLAGLALLSAFPIVASLLPATRAWFVQTQGVVSVGGLHVLKQQFGWVVLGAAAVAQVEGVVAIICLVRNRRRVRPGYRWHFFILFFSQGFASIAIWLEIIGANPFAPISIFNLSLIPTCFAICWAMYALRVGQTLPLMREKVVETMHDGVIILVDGQQAAYLNPAAGEMFGLPAGQPGARPLAQWAPELAAHLAAYPHPDKSDDGVTLGEMSYSLGRSVLEDWKGDSVGQVLVLRNVTDRERLERTLQARATELARSSAFTQSLSLLAARVAASADLEQVYNTLRDELHRLGLEFSIGRRVPGQSGYVIEYLSLEGMIVHVLERFFGMRAIGFRLPELGAVTDPRMIQEDGAIFVPSLVDYIHLVFDMFPENFEQILLEMAGISLHISSFTFPLTAQGEDIGILSIWGPSLRREDQSPLSTFAAQVSAAIQKGRLLQNEQARVAELESTNRLVLSLTQVAARFEANLSQGQILETLGTELRKLEAICVVAFLDPDTNELVGHYSSAFSDVWETATRLAGVSLPDTRIAYRDWQALDGEGRGSVITDPLGWLGKVLPVPQAFIERAMPLVGITPQTPLVWLPLRASGRRIGVLTLWGISEPQQHLTFFSLFATQVATALEKARLMADLETLKSFNEGIVQGVAEAIVLVNREDQITFANLAAGKLVGLPSAALAGQPWQRFLPPEAQATLHTFTAGQPGQTAVGIELNLLDGAGQTIPVLLNLQRLTSAGQPVSTLVSLIDIRQRIQAEQQIRASMQEKEALLKEIHHRVKNNLQIISSLLNLQAGRIQDPVMVEAFRESQNRVRSMALIHEKLYRSDNLARIRLDEYIRELTHFLMRTYQEAARAVRLDIVADPVNLDIDTAIPCGLIVNELVSNALKHGFPGGEAVAPGRIGVYLTLLPEGRLRLRIEDNGPGFPADLEARRTSSLGLQLVTSLTRQLAGEVTFTTHAGAQVELAFTSASAYLSAPVQTSAPDRAAPSRARPPMS